MNTNTYIKAESLRDRTQRIINDPTICITESICPICGKHFTPSAYLAKIFADNPKALFIANLVTHYRHKHRESWDKCWGRYGGYYRRGWFRDYDEEKKKVNEQAKRQIIRKATTILIQLGVTSETFKCLQQTDEKTIALAVKRLDMNKNNLQDHTNNAA